MKKIYLFTGILLIFVLFSTNTVLSQQLNKENNKTAAFSEMLAGAYTFSYDTGTYSNLVGSTSLSKNDIWDFTPYACPIGFDFKFFNIAYDTVTVSDPNDIQFGPTMGKYWITVYGSDLADRALGDGTFKAKSPISYSLVDTAPNRILKIEWKNAGYLKEITDTSIIKKTNFINLQLWLYETSNNIEIHFGPSLVTYKNLAYESCPGYKGPNISLNNNVNSKYICLIGDSSKPTVSTLPEQYMNGTPPNGMIYKFDAGYVNNIANKLKGNYSFFPNPVTDAIHIMLPERSEWTNVQVYNLLGNEIMNKHFNSTDHINLNVNSLPQGTYLLKLQNSATTITHKFTKQ